MAAPLLGALLIAWIAWFGLGRVTIYEATSQARLEVQSAAHPVAAPVGGRVVETRLAVGRDVRSGEVLVALDGAAEQFANPGEAGLSRRPGRPSGGLAGGDPG